MFDAILTDLLEPAPDGEAVARAARELRPEACVYVCSADAATPRSVDRAGARFLAGKPRDDYAMIAQIFACRSCDTCRYAQRCHGPRPADDDDLDPL